MSKSNETAEQTTARLLKNKQRREARAALKAKAQSESAQPVTSTAKKQRTPQQILFSKRIENEKSNLYRIFGEDKAALVTFITNNVADEQKNAAVRLARRDALRWASPAKACPF